ncbi:MAG: hypothetical protein H8D26_01465 [Methanomicrobia archaeon]|nr:hypothetical protein [Methanomicrobia archaeon]
MRKDVIRTKIKEIEECVGLVEEHLPDTFEGFSSMGLINKKNRGIFRERRMRRGIYMGSPVETLAERPDMHFILLESIGKSLIDSI